MCRPRLLWRYRTRPNGLLKHGYEYGFIIRYPEGKESITGYKYEPWHIRYVGVDAATEIFENSITLEEYYNAVPVNAAGNRKNKHDLSP